MIALIYLYEPVINLINASVYPIDRNTERFGNAFKPVESMYSLNYVKCSFWLHSFRTPTQAMQTN